MKEWESMITFIKGRSGRGKTYRVFQEIARDLQEKKIDKIFLIVPDQMSFQTEFELLHTVDQDAMMSVEVVGINRFVSRLLEEILPIQYTQFESLAQKMLLQQSAHVIQSDLTVYENAVDKSGFIDYLHQFLRQTKGSLQAFEELDTVPGLDQYPILKAKLSEIQSIFLQYEKLVTERLFDNSDKMNFLLTLLQDEKNQKVLEKYAVYIDGYYTFNNQEFSTLTTALMYAAKGMVTFDSGKQLAKDQSIFSLVEYQYKQFIELFPTAITEFVSSSNDRFSENTVLNQIEANYEFPRALTIPEELRHTADISIYQTKEEEVKHVAQQIRKLLLEKKVRAKEITVYVPDKEIYGELIEHIFERYDIPFYLDIKESMLIHPVIQWLHTLLKIQKDNWQFDDVLHLSQNVFFQKTHNIEKADYYLFLKHVERLTSFHPTVWKQDKHWLYFDRPERLEQTLNEEHTRSIEYIRQAIITEITTFKDCLKGKTNRERLTKVFTYMNEHHVAAFLENETSIQSKYTSHITEKQYQEAVWKQLIFVFEQANLAVGEIKGSQKAIVTTLMYGLEAMEFTSTPIGFDQVMIGDFERSRFQTLHQEDVNTKMGVQYAYVLGIIDSYVPHIQSAGSLLTDKDIAVLQEHNCLEDILIQEHAMLYQLFRFYTMVTSATKELHLSYFRFDGVYNDNACFPSLVLDTFGENGFNLPTREVIGELSAEQYAIATPAILKTMLSKNYQVEKEKRSLLYQTIVKQDSFFIEYLNTAHQYANNVNIKTPVTTNKQLSLTQIETYNQCPYKYFVQYVLGVKEPFTGGMEALQSGTLLHNCYELVIQDAITNHVRTADIQLDLQQQHVRTFFGETKEQLKNHPLLRQQVNHYLLDKIEAVAATSLMYLYKNEAQTRFFPTYVEQVMPVYDLTILGEQKQIIGKVDRIDVSEDGNFFRIVDYKSSQRAIDFNQLYAGTQLQLPLYSFLATKLMNKELAGSMYVPLQDHILTIEDIEGTKLEDLQQKAYQASGFFLQEEKSIQLFDQSIIENRKSVVIPYSETKNGEPTSFSAVMKKEEIESMQAYSIQTAEKTVEKIVKHEFNITPRRRDFDDSTTPCTYCKFKQICQFDRKINKFNDCRSTIKGRGFQEKKNDFIEKIGQKIEKE